MSDETIEYPRDHFYPGSPRVIENPPVEFRPLPSGLYQQFNSGVPVGEPIDPMDLCCKKLVDGEWVPW